MSDLFVRSEHVADQTNAAGIEALSLAFQAIEMGDREAIRNALGRLATVSWEAGWDQAHADLRAIVHAHTGIDIGAGR